MKDTWTSLHDIALIYIGLAYGTDHNLTDAELNVIVESIKKRGERMTIDDARTVVMDAVAVYLAGDSATEIANSIHLLKASLSPKSRQRTLDDLVRIAKSDGLLLGSERSMISVLAEAWELRESNNEDWPEPHDESVLEVISLLYIIIAHAGDREITDSEVEAMVSRLQQWQPAMSEAEARAVLRAALKYYSSEPKQSEYNELVGGLRDNLPTPQLLAVLDDLNAIAIADGALDSHEANIIHSLATAWNLVVRLNGAP